MSDFNPWHWPWSPLGRLRLIPLDNLTIRQALRFSREHPQILSPDVVHSAIRQAMRNRYRNHTGPTTRQDRRCARGLHLWRDRYGDGRDMACVCDHCGTQEN